MARGLPKFTLLLIALVGLLVRAKRDDHGRRPERRRFV